jgi:aspartyl protease family protein
MIARYAIFAAGVVGFVLIAVPRGGEWDENTNSTVFRYSSKPKRADTIQGQANAAWYSGDHTLSRRGDGHFYATTTINGASAYMLVDTGASVIALTGSDAQSAGIQWDESAVRPVGRGASGTVYGVRTRLEEVAVGDLTHRNVEAIIVPNGLEVSLLGQSYLSRLKNVEISGDTMTLSGG